METPRFPPEKNKHDMIYDGVDLLERKSRLFWFQLMVYPALSGRERMNRLEKDEGGQLANLHVGVERLHQLGIAT